MTASSYTTNPRRIIHIPPSQIDLSFKRDPKTTVIETFSFGGVDLSGLHGGGSISGNAEIFLEVRNRQDVQRVPLGILSKQTLLTDQLISISGQRSSLTWHFFIREGFLIKASNEGVKAKDSSDNNGDSQGLLLVEPDDLGEILWRVHPLDGHDEPKLKVNLDPDLNVLHQLKAKDPSFRAFIVPNAIEQILRVIASHPGSGDPSDWQTKWQTYFQNLGIDPCPGADADAEKEEWIETTVRQLANEFKLVTQLKRIG